MGSTELKFVEEAFASNWVAPAGPHIAALEQQIAAYVGRKHAIAVSSGTAALHLALRKLGLKESDEVYCSTLTFAASAFPILYERAAPVFIDSDAGSWNMDPRLLEREVERAKKAGKLPKAVICVDLYGQCADWRAVRAICAHYDIPLIEDSAEALGSTYGDSKAGAFGWASLFSFNGNKIITTSGGGALCTDDAKLAEMARKISQQARDVAPHYQHSELGFNYRMSNIAAAIGLGQMQVIDERVSARRRIAERYMRLLERIPGISFMPEASYGRSNRWLTCIQVDPEAFGASREDIRKRLELDNIESRPVWKPMHMQPVFAGCRVVGGRISEKIFENGLCLPSGSSMSDADIDRVVANIMALSRHSDKRWQPRAQA